jgi:hypothetical protein
MDSTSIVVTYLLNLDSKLHETKFFQLRWILNGTVISWTHVNIENFCRILSENTFLIVVLL